MGSAQNEYGILKSVLLKKPAQAFRDSLSIDIQWMELNYTSKPDLGKAISEYDKLIGLLDSMDTSVHFLDSDNDTGLDSIYTRDASIATNHGMIICNMGKGARIGEPAAQKVVLEKADYSILGQIEPPGTIEGGDVAWLDENTLAVGLGYRTNESGINQLRELLSGFAEVFEVHLPHYKGSADVFHLMSIFSPVDKNLAVVYSPLMTVHFREFLITMGYTLVEVPAEEFESMACNVLALGPRKCLMLEGNPITKNRLIKEGVEVYEYSGTEISLKGCGGPTCLTRPLIRE